LNPNSGWRETDSRQVPRRKSPTPTREQSEAGSDGVEFESKPTGDDACSPRDPRAILPAGTDPQSIAIRSRDLRFPLTPPSTDRRRRRRKLLSSRFPSSTPRIAARDGDGDGAPLVQIRRRRLLLLLGVVRRPLRGGAPAPIPGELRRRRPPRREVLLPVASVVSRLLVARRVAAGVHALDPVGIPGVHAPDAVAATHVSGLHARLPGVHARHAGLHA